MTTPVLTRRDFMVQTVAATATAAATATMVAAEPARPGSGPARPLHVVCVGAHPDDPECGCGGTLARYVEAGHRVTVIYLTRGEAGISGKSAADAAAIRTAEGEAACKILGAQAVFAGQIDAATEVNRQRKDEFYTLLTGLKPDLVLSHWPIDTHSDHQVAAMLTVRAYFRCKERFPLYFYEVAAGLQTFNFTPTVYVDITTVREKKKAALFAHKSQNGEGVYQEFHRLMEDFRGRELSVAAAEAFVPMARDHGRSLPELR
jgi:LmbE family N-acetylglucosaminyl deacetylase